VTRHASGAARRYARALLELAEGQKGGAAVRRGLADSVRLLAEQNELRAVLEHPAVGAERKRAVIDEVWGREHELVRRLIALLAQRERISLLPEIERLYARLWNEQRGVVAAEALTAIPLGDGAEQRLAGALRQATGREIELATTLAREILGGVVVKMDGRIYDGSVRAKLRALRERLVGQAEGA
jgi:F-type H+-transporting ATPase subunit delta